METRAAPVIDIHFYRCVIDKKKTCRYLCKFCISTNIEIWLSTKTMHGCLKRFLLIFLTKMSYCTSQNVGNPVQIINYVELSRFQTILKRLLKRCLLVSFTNSDLWQNEGAFHNFKLLIMLEYRLCCLICAESDK